MKYDMNFLHCARGVASRASVLDMTLFHDSIIVLLSLYSNGVSSFYFTRLSHFISCNGEAKIPPCRQTGAKESFRIGLRADQSITLVFQVSTDLVADLGNIVTSDLKSSMHYILNINLAGTVELSIASLNAVQASEKPKPSFSCPRHPNHHSSSLRRRRC